MTRAARLLAGALALVPACGDDLAGRTRPAAGTVAHFSGAGEVDVIDFGSGRVDTIRVASGEAQGLSLAPDASAVAFIVRSNLRRHVHRAEVVTGEVEEITPYPRGDSIVWGVGFFLYRVRVDGRTGQALVRDGETEPRVLPEQVVVAPGAPTVAYVEDDRVFVESVAIGERTEVAQGLGTRPVLFTEDGTSLLLVEPVDEVTSGLVRLEVDSGARTDLGPLGPGGTYAGDLSRLSPDESEVVAGRSDQIRAVRMDGSGDRVVWTQSDDSITPWIAGFTGPGDIVYVLEENLTPGSDTPEVLEHLWIERGRVSAPLLEDRRNCNGPVASSSGDLIAWPCEDATHVFSAADGAEVLSIAGFTTVLGFDRADSGILVAPWGPDDEIVWVDLSGNEEPIAAATTTDAWAMDFVP